MTKKKGGISKASFYAIIAFVVSFFAVIVFISYSNTPCHDMPGGSLMGNCDDEKVNGLAIVSASSYLPGQNAGFVSSGPVKSSTIVDVADGETFTMTADIITKNIDGNDIVMYGYNGMVPGPALRVKQGSTINVIFQNNIDMNTTVHWHGLRHDIEDDGVPGISQGPVIPGGEFEYQLYFPDDGIYWYHPHIREEIQQDAGMSGNMLVIPTDPYNSVNREELIILDDLLLDSNGQMVPFGGEYANFAIMGRYGNTMLTNGDTNYELSIQKGEVVRFYLTNVANVRPFNFSIAGAKMKLVGGDLGQFEREEFVDSVVIAPAMRYFIDVYFENSGSYDLMNINPHEEYILGTVTVSNEEAAISYKDSFENDRINQKVIDDIAGFEEYFDKAVDYELTLTVNMDGMMDMMDSLPCHSMGGIVMGDCTPEERAELEGELEHGEETIEWEDEMNMRASEEFVDWIIEDKNTKKQNKDIGMSAKVGDVVKMRLFNDPESVHPMQHPIHLHGQRVLILEMDGVSVENKVWTDTILIPIGSTADILVDVTNPGEWVMHCHIAEHLEAGMVTSLMVE